MLPTTARGLGIRAREFQSWNLVAAWGVAVSLIWLAAILIGRYVPVPRGTPPPRSPVEVLSTWDGTHYTHIATNGHSAEGDEARRFGFFPLLPAMARLLGDPFSRQTLAGILFTQLCLLGSVLLLGRIAHGDQPAPLRAQPGFWLLVSPLSFFFSVLYTESLFLVLSLLMVVAYRGERFLAATVFGILAGVTRATAVVLPSLFAWDVIQRFRRGEEWRGPLLCTVAPLIGVTFWIAFVGYSVGDPFGYFDIMARWWRHDWAIPFAPMLRDGLGYLAALRDGRLPLSDQIVRHFSTLSVLALVIWGWRRLDHGFLAYLAVAMIFIHAHDPPVGTARHELVLFPVFLLLPTTALARPRIAPLAAGLLIAIQFLFFFDHATWRWVA